MQYVQRFKSFETFPMHQDSNLLHFPHETAHVSLTKMEAEALGAQPLYFRHLCLHLPLFFHHKQGLLHLYDQGNLSLHPGKSNLHFMILNYAGVEYF